MRKLIKMLFLTLLYLYLSSNYINKIEFIRYEDENIIIENYLKEENHEIENAHILNESLSNLGIISAYASQVNTSNVYYRFNEEKSIIPMSLAKLFVIDFALNIVDKDDLVKINNYLLSKVPEYSSLANFSAGEYSVKNLVEGILIPSGNDAALALADYVGKRLNNNVDSKDNIDLFLIKLNEYLKKQGFNYTKIVDPSGYMNENKTTVEELFRVTQKLLENDWIKDIIKKSEYTVETPDLRKINLKNSNKMLNKDYYFYNPDVLGVKTGTSDEIHNLIVLYNDFILIEIGANSDYNRYLGMNNIINEIKQH